MRVGEIHAFARGRKCSRPEERGWVALIGAAVGYAQSESAAKKQLQAAKAQADADIQVAKAQLEAAKAMSQASVLSAEIGGKKVTTIAAIVIGGTVALVIAVKVLFRKK